MTFRTLLSIYDDYMNLKHKAVNELDRVSKLIEEEKDRQGTDWIKGKYADVLISQRRYVQDEIERLTGIMDEIEGTEIR